MAIAIANVPLRMVRSVNDHRVVRERLGIHNASWVVVFGSGLWKMCANAASCVVGLRVRWKVVSQ